MCRIAYPARPPGPVAHFSMSDTREIRAKRSLQRQSNVKGSATKLLILSRLTS